MTLNRKKDSTEGSLERKTIGGIFWTIIEMLGRQGVTFVIQIILARLLIPEDFGLVGMLTVFISLSNLLTDSGFQTWLIHKKNPTQIDFSTVFVFNIFAATIIYLLLFLSAPQIGHFFKSPVFVPLLRFLSLTVIFNSLSLIHRTKLTIALKFKTQTYITMFSITLSGLVAVILAYLGFGVWSLVTQQVIASIIQSVLLIVINNWIPQITFSVSSFKIMFKYSWKLLASYSLDILYNNLNAILIGRFFSASTLGYFTNAQKVNDVAGQSIATAVQKVSFPVLSGIKDEKETLKNGYQRILGFTSFIVIPIMLGMSACGVEIFKIVFGDKWLLAVPYFQIMCFGGMFYPMHMLNLNILQVAGRTDRFLILEVCKKIISILGTIITLLIFKSVLSLVCISVIFSYLSLYINSYFSEEMIGYSFENQLRDIFKPLISGVIMFAFVFLIGQLLKINIVLLLMVKVLIGIILYVGLCRLFGVKEIFVLREFIVEQIYKLKRC